jgi:pilus assembly protein CpaC
VKNRTKTRLAVIAAAACAAEAALGAPSEALAQPKRTPKDEAAQQQEIGLAVGENKTIPATDVKQYSEGTPGVVDVRLTPDQQKFVIVGQKAGSTTLLLIKNDGSQTTLVISVFTRAPELVERELKALLDGYVGLSVRRVGPRLFIDGGVATEADQSRIKQIAALYPGQVESLVTVGSGSSDRKINIRIDFFFVQYTKRSGLGVGIDWPGRYGGEFASGSLGFDFVANAITAGTLVVNQPLPALDIAANNGWAKVIKQSTVVTTNGNEATFESGGELNFAVTGGLSSEIRQIPYGTNVKVLPRFDVTSRDIEVKVTADVSDLSAPDVSSLPGRQTTKLSTLVFLKLGQSLVLSGIKTSSHRRGTRGIPLLSEIPVLGVLFGSLSDQKEEVEGAVYIIPSVVEPAPKPGYDLIKEAMAQYEKYSGDMDDVNAFPKAPPAPPVSTGSPAPEAPQK